MKSNRILQWLLAATALLTASCSEQDTTTVADGSAVLHATIDDDYAATRSIVVDNPGVKLESFWHSGDRLGVFGQSDRNVSFTIAEGSITHDGKSADFKSATGIPAGSLLAYYPYSSSATGSSSVLALDFPATQHYVEVGGVAQPDPAACVMVGTGTKDDGISFVNLMSVVKVGQVFTEPTTVQRVEFRDLAGSPVCGAYSVDLSSGQPVTTFSGVGQVLTLDLGSEGRSAAGGSLFTAFLVVPARDYPKGFEITFVAADGTKTVKTAGSKDGKTLRRSVVYPVGDISTYQEIPGMTYELKPGTQVMTPDKLDMVKVLSSQSSYVKTDDGTLAVDANGNYVVLPTLTMSVHKDLNPQAGGYLIFNHPTSDMPQGGVFKVEQCRLAADGNHFEVVASPEPNFAAPFETLTIGEPLYDEDGNLQPDAGVDIDISSYVREIRDGDGKVLSTRTVPTYDTNVSEAMDRMSSTRATVSHTYNPPALTLSADDGSHCTCDVTAQMSLGVRLAVGVIAGELQYVYTTVNPKLSLKTTFGLYGKAEWSKRQHLLTLVTTGIPIGPIIVIPEISFDMVGGVGGEMKFSASTTFNYDLGTYGLIYNKGQGLSFRYTPVQPAKDDSFNPTLDNDFSGSLYAYGGIGVRAGLSIYALCSLGAATDATLKFAVVTDMKNPGGLKLALTPEVSIKPYTAVIGGRFARVWDGLSGKIELDPIWERYIIPGLYGTSGMELIYTNPIRIKWSTSGIESFLTTTVSTGANIGYDITVKGKPFYDWDVAVRVYRSSSFEYMTLMSNSDPDDVVKDWEANGVLHLWNPVVFMAKPSYVKDVVIGQYTTQDDSVNFKGTLPYDFESGVAYAVETALVSGSRHVPEIGPKPHIINGKPYDGMLGKIFFWPYRSNGDSY